MARLQNTETIDGGAPAAPAPAHGAADARRWWALGFIVMGYLTVFSSVTIMNIALPAAQRDLEMSDAGRQWVITIYALTFGGLMLLGGRVADVVGLRRGLIGGLVGFGAASVLGGLAPTAGVLLAGRAGQGIAGALVAAAALALLSVTFSHGEERTRAFSALGAVMGLGGAGAFVAGGVLTDMASWRWCLLVLAPLALVSALGVAATATERSATGRRRLGLPSALLITGAAGGLVAGFDRAQAVGWRAAPTVTLLVAGVGLLAAFITVQRRAATPLLPLELVADRTRATAFGAVFALGFGLFAGLFFLTFYLQDVRGYTPLRTGFAFLPFGVAAMSSSYLITPVLRRVSPAAVLGGGLASLATAIATLTRLQPESSYAAGVLPAFVLLGIGATTVMVTASNLATSGAGAHSGVAGATVGASQQIGAALGTALLSSVAATATAEYTANHAGAEVAVRAAVHGFTRASAVGAAIVAAAAVAIVTVALTRRSSPAAQVTTAVAPATAPGGARDDAR